jgi:hypothetical protein
MLNGQNNDQLGVCTCQRHNGSSTPDYIFCRGRFGNFTVSETVLGSLSDHYTLSVVVPWACTRASFAAENSGTVYRWVDGSSLADYSHTWRAWNTHTDTSEFAAAFTAVLDTHVGDLDILT